MSRKGENIYKRKDGRWEGRFIKYHDVQGKAHYGYVYGKTYAAVRQLLREKQSQASIMLNESKKSNPTYQSILISWLETQRINIKESTYAKYYQIIYTHIIPDMGTIKTEKITAKLIERYVSQLIESGRIDKKGGLSSKTTSDILTIIKSSIEYAKYNGYPVQCNLDKVCVKQSKNEIRVLSLEEQQRLTTVLMQDTDLIKFGVLLSLYTGIRIGEVCALRWGSLNMESGILSIKETLQRIKNTSNHSTAKTKIVITEPKSKYSVRDIPLPPFILAIAKGFQYSNSAFILTGEKNRYIEPRTMQNRFKSITQECQICDANYHSLRHTFATRCVELGFEIKTLSEILGHSSVNITLNRYVHSSLGLKKENMAKVTCIS